MDIGRREADHIPGDAHVPRPEAARTGIWGTASPGSAAGCSESIRDWREEQGSGIENTHRHPNKYIRVILQVQGSHWSIDVATCSWTSSGRFFSPPLSSGVQGRPRWLTDKTLSV